MPGYLNHEASGALQAVQVTSSAGGTKLANAKIMVHVNGGRWCNPYPSHRSDIPATGRAINRIECGAPMRAWKALPRARRWAYTSTYGEGVKTSLLT